MGSPESSPGAQETNFGQRLEAVNDQIDRAQAEKLKGAELEKQERLQLLLDICQRMVVAKDKMNEPKLLESKSATHHRGRSDEVLIHFPGAEAASNFAPRSIEEAGDMQRALFAKLGIDPSHAVSTKYLRGDAMGPDREEYTVFYRTRELNGEVENVPDISLRQRFDAGQLASVEVDLRFVDQDGNLIQAVPGSEDLQQTAA